MLRARLALLLAAAGVSAACGQEDPSTDVTPSPGVDYLVQQGSECAQPVDGSGNPGVGIELARCSRAPAQRFRFVERGGGLEIHNNLGGLCLEPAGAAATPAAPVVQTTCRQVSTQRFTARRSGDGLTFTAQGSDLVLSVAPTSGGGSPRLELAAPSGRETQRFVLAVADGGGASSSGASSGGSSSGASSSGASSSGASSSGASSSGASSSGASSSGASSSGGGSGSSSSSGSSSGASSGGGSSGSSSGGSSGGGECARGRTRGSEVAVIGESFIAATHGITQQIEKDARAAGSLGQSERYVDTSVSGTTLANGQIASQYAQAVQRSGTIKYVLMDGGGNDCLLNDNGDAALAAARSLFQAMAQNRTEKVVYFFYPDPIGGNFARLKSCLDALRPKMKSLCDGLTAPRCHWLDLRPTWSGHPEYTSDGIHPTSAGSVATGDAIWRVMQASCVAQ